MKPGIGSRRAVTANAGSRKQSITDGGISSESVVDKDNIKHIMGRGSRKSSIVDNEGGIVSNNLLLDTSISAKQLFNLLKTTSSFYGSQFAFRARLPPIKQLLDNLLFQYPHLTNSQVTFVLDITQSIEKESRLLDLLLNEIPGLRQADRDIDSIIIYLLLYRLDGFGLNNIKSLARLFPSKMIHILTYLLMDMSKDGDLFRSLFRWHDLRFINHRILEPLKRMLPDLHIILNKIQKKKVISSK